jgi:ATP-dependent Clp protease adaptor protein ClpS
MSTDLSTDTLTKLKVPSLYKVILLNDDFTPMDFVMQVLEEIFNKTTQQAEALCMEVHNAGRGIAGIYSKEVAEQKVYEVTTIARSYKHPLKTISEVA